MAKVLVTPEMADKWVKTNVENNRNINYTTVATYARMMTEGKWYMSPDYIAFDDNGCLFNGQHRLSAVILSGVSVWMNVDFGGYDDNSMAVTDQGATRSATDIAKVLGYDAVYRSHVSQAFIRNIQYTKLGASRRIKYSRNEVIDLITKYYYVCEYIYRKSIGTKLRNAGIMIAVVSALINGENEDDVDTFINELNGDINASAHKKVNHNAAAEARNILFYDKYRTSSQSGGGHNCTVDGITMDCQRLMYKYIHDRKNMKKVPIDIYPVNEIQLASFNEILRVKSEEKKEA